MCEAETLVETVVVIETKGTLAVNEVPTVSSVLVVLSQEDVFEVSYVTARVFDYDVLEYIASTTAEPRMTGLASPIKD